MRIHLGVCVVWDVKGKFCLEFLGLMCFIGCVCVVVCLEDFVCGDFGCV